MSLKFIIEETGNGKCNVHLYENIEETTNDDGDTIDVPKQYFDMADDEEFRESFVFEAIEDFEDLMYDNP